MRSNDRPRVRATNQTKIERAGYYMGLAIVITLTIVVVGLLLLAGAWAALQIISYF